MSAHGPPSERISAEEPTVDKQATEFLDEVEGGQDAVKPSRTLKAPPLVRDLSPADRERLEKKLVRKIDFRLLPPVIIMYIMNYLDRVWLSSAPNSLCVANHAHRTTLRQLDLLATRAWKRILA